MEKIKSFAKKLLKDLNSLPEDKMKLHLLGKRLGELEPGDIARLINVIYSPSPGLPGARKVQTLLVNPRGLREIIGPDRYRLTYCAAIDMGLKKVSRLFTDLPPYKKGPFGYDKEEEAKMEFLTLGERRAKAKGNVKDTLDRLLSDPDTRVIENLLNNPRITETEVLKIASKRPNSSEILKLLSTHRKWSKRYTVIKALVFNPYTPPRISLGLLGFLMSPDLETLAADKTLHPQVKLSAKELVLERRGSSQGE